MILLPSVTCDINKCNHSSQDWLWGKAILLVLVNWQHGIATNSVPGSHQPYHCLQTHKSEEEGHKPGPTPVFPDPAPRNKMRLILGRPELKISLHRHFAQTLPMGTEARSKLHDAPTEGRSIWLCHCHLLLAWSFRAQNWNFNEKRSLLVFKGRRLLLKHVVQCSRCPGWSHFGFPAVTWQHCAAIG